ncbi:quercetin 2,3-dioxygenase [Halogeometricum limi]|uniref:Cupin domain-containing protein n=1 Tax=Halogeometricum limi TaxID=555875 RepID=A0A1I6G1E3_9EURY|nr:quercetin 2,3-dioxygenase [Halogeometricum limi]SFR35961.1 Cupin domain-containing protein [Halogeometricum limi]
MSSVHNDAPGEPFVKRRDEGPAYHALGAVAILKATAEETGGSFSLVERRGDEGSVVTPLHVHRSEDELWYVLDGEIELYVDGSIVSATAGDTAFTPHGVPHAFRIAADGTRYLICRSPGNETFFEDVGTSVADPSGPAPEPTDAEWARVEAVVDKYGIEILGPPPFDDAAL